MHVKYSVSEEEKKKINLSTAAGREKFFLLGKER
jgi:hypothetical protein